MIENQWKLALKIISIFFLFVGVIWFFNKILWILSLIVVSLLIVYSISPVVVFLKKHKVPHFLAVLIVYFGFLLSIVLFLYLIIPTIINELRDLIRYFSTTEFNLIMIPFMDDFESLVVTYNLAESIEGFLQQLPSYLQQALEQTINFTRVVFSSLVDIFIVTFLVFYLLRDLEKIKHTIIRLFPLHLKIEATRVMDMVDTKVGAYLRGNFLRCGIVGVLTGIGLGFLGMPFAFMLGLLAGVLNIIVYIGPYIAGIPAVFLSLSTGTPGPLIIIIFYVSVQAVDAFLVTPVLLGKAVDLSPFTVIVAILIGATLIGLLGILISIPIAATLKVVLQYYYFKEERV